MAILTGDFLFARGQGGLGYAVPAAIGAAMARPEGRVITIAGMHLGVKDPWNQTDAQLQQSQKLEAVGQLAFEFFGVPAAAFERVRAQVLAQQAGLVRQAHQRAQGVEPGEMRRREPAAARVEPQRGRPGQDPDAVPGPDRVPVLDALGVVPHPVAVDQAPAGPFGDSQHPAVDVGGHPGDRGRGLINDCRRRFGETGQTPYLLPVSVDGQLPLPPVPVETGEQVAVADAEAAAPQRLDDPAAAVMSVMARACSFSAFAATPRARVLRAPAARRAVVTGLESPRAVYPLSNGDVLVVESQKTGTEPVDRPKDPIRDFIMSIAHGGGGAKDAGPPPQRITLLRDADGDGRPELKTVLLDHLNSPFGIAVVGNALYVANTDAIVRYPFAAGQTRITAPGEKVADRHSAGRHRRPCAGHPRHRRLPSHRRRRQGRHQKDCWRR